MRTQRSIPSFTLGRICIWKLRKKEDKKTEMKNKKQKVLKVIEIQPPEEDDDKIEILDKIVILMSSQNQLYT